MFGPAPGCTVRAGRRAAGGRGDAVAAASEPAADSSAWLGSVYAALAAGGLDAEELARGARRAPRRRGGACLRGGCQHLGPLRRRVLTGPGVLLLTDPALGRPTHRGRLVQIGRASCRERG